MQTSEKNICEAAPFALKFARESKRSETYKRGYRNIAKHLREYEQSRGIVLLSNSYTYSVAEDFVFYLKDKNLMLNTIAYILSKVAHMYNVMRRAGFEVDNSYVDYSVKNEETGAVSLSESEIEAIYNLSIKEPAIALVRDIFVLGCCTGQRYGTYSKLNNDNLINEAIHVRTNKTAALVIIPLHRYVREIIQKYSGIPCYKRSAQNFNKVIKNLCKRAKINDKILIERHRGHKYVRKLYKKYELIGTHTARRSFATNAYLAGIPTMRIMLITGHKTEQAFFRYIKINKSENAKELQSHVFFV